MSVTPEQPTPTPLPSAPEFPGATAPESATYRPLSLLALASFGLALCVAVPIVVGAIVALVTRTPLLLPPWLVLIAVVVLLVAWVARLQIKAAEDTQTGLALTTWAVRLVVVLMPLYGAYYLATYSAVTYQADKFTRDFLTLLAAGDVEKAFWFTVEPGKRPAEQSRDNLQVNFNQPNEQGSSPYNGVATADWVRFLRNGGPETKVDLIGVVDWTYELSGYRVTTLYKITSKFATFDLIVAAQSTPESSGRKWTILTRGTGRAQSSQITFTAPDGQRYTEASAPARAALEAVTTPLNTNDAETAFLRSLPEDVAKVQARKQTRPVLLGLLGGPLTVATADADGRTALATRLRWFGGAIFETQRFWTLPDPTNRLRNNLLTAVQRTLGQGPLPTGRFAALTTTLPLHVPGEGGMELYGFDVQIIIPRPEVPNTPPLVVDGIAYVRVKPGTTQAEGIERIELLAGRSMQIQAPPSGPARP